MVIENNVLALISKLMKENVQKATEITSCYQKLDVFLNDDFVKCLDSGLYNDNASLISEIRQGLMQMRFWDCVPMLYAKQYINVFSALEDVKQYIDNIVELDEWIFRNDDIPVIFVNSNVDDFSVSAITYDEKLVEISKEEYELICKEFDDFGIEKKKLVRFFIVELKEWNERNCLCVWQEKSFDEMEIISCFQKTNYLNVLFGKSVSHIERRLWAIKQKNLYILSSAEVLTQVSEALLKNNADKIKELMQEDYFITILRGEIKDNTSRSELNKLRMLLFEVETFYKHEISKIKIIKKEMHEDLLHLSEGDTKKSIVEFLSEQQAKENLFSDKLVEFQRISEDLIDFVRKYEILRDKEYIGEDKEYDFQYDSYLEKLYVELVRNGEDKRAQECLRCMRDADIAELEIFEAFFKYQQENELDEDDKLKIINFSNKNEAISRIKILLSEQLHYSEEQLLDIVDTISEPKSGKEYFWFAKRALRNHDKESAADFFKKAFENGEKKAAASLIDMSCNDGIPNLSELARMMIPEANFRLGIDQIEDNIDEAWVNLKIASAKKNVDAIKVVAEVLFEMVKKLSISEMENIEKKENVINIICMYEFLLQKEDMQQYKIRIGLMYCKLQDYRRALDYLEKIDEDEDMYPEAMYQCALIYENGLGVAVNINKAKEFYRKCGDYEDASIRFVDCMNREKQERQSLQNNYKEEREIQSVEKSGFCFITTAACMALKKGKDCNELNKLRHFRDEYIANEENGNLLISEYYRIGPDIVNRIDREWNPVAIYMQLWSCYINPSYRCIAEEKFEEAKMIYVDMVKRLCEKYQIKVDEKISKDYDIIYN